MEKEVIGYAWNYTANFGNDTGFSLSGNFVQGLSKEEMSAEIDKIRSVIERQQSKSAARGLEEEIDRLAAQEKTVIDTIGRVDGKAEAKGGSSAAERQQRDAALLNLEHLRANIGSKQKILKKLVNEAK